MEFSTELHRDGAGRSYRFENWGGYLDQIGSRLEAISKTTIMLQKAEDTK